jgi:16S rRNA (guanine527-N7)-methyltransferase
MKEKIKHYAAALKVEVREKEAARMQAYWEQIKAASLNLTAIKDDDMAAELHFADSLTPLAYNLIPEGTKVLDIGTGGGFSAVPLAIMRPDIRVWALDGTKKKLSFIEAQTKDLQIALLHGRAEALAHEKTLREQFDVVIARAVAATPTLAEYLLPFVRCGGRMIAYTGIISKEEDVALGKAASLLGGEKAVFYPAAVGERSQEHRLCIVEKHGITPPNYPRRANKAKSEPLGYA